MLSKMHLNTQSQHELVSLKSEKNRPHGSIHLLLVLDTTKLYNQRLILSKIIKTVCALGLVCI